MSKLSRLRLSTTLPLLVFLLMLGFLVTRIGNADNILPSALLDQPLPDFALPSLANEEHLLHRSDLAKEPALLTVWASWCLACQDEQALLLQISQQQQLPIYGLNYKDQRGEALRWLARFGNPFRASIFDEQGSLGIDLGVYGVPESYLLDGKGVIRYKWVGALTEQVWVDELLPRLLALRGAR